MSNDRDNDNVVSLSAFRAAQKPTDAATASAVNAAISFENAEAPHKVFQDLMREPVIGSDMLPDVFRSILPQLAYRFNHEGQKNPKILEKGGLTTTTLALGAYSFAPASFRELINSFRADMEENEPKAYRATMRKAWKAAAGLDPKERENLIIQTFANTLVASTGAYKATARILGDAMIKRLSFEPALVVGHKENDPTAIYVEPRIKLTSAVSRHGDIRTVLRSYLERVEKDTRPNGKPDLRPV